MNPRSLIQLSKTLPVKLLYFSMLVKHALTSSGKKKKRKKKKEKEEHHFPSNGKWGKLYRAKN